MVRSGEIDWTEADELEGLVGRSSDLSSAFAYEPLRIVQQINRSSLHVTKDMLEVRGTEVIVHLPPDTDKADAISAELRAAGLLRQVTLDRRETRRDTPPDTDDTRRSIQKTLF